MAAEKKKLPDIYSESTDSFISSHQDGQVTTFLSWSAMAPATSSPPRWPQLLMLRMATPSLSRLLSPCKLQLVSWLVVTLCDFALALLLHKLSAWTFYWVFSMNIKSFWCLASVLLGLCFILFQIQTLFSVSCNCISLMMSVLYLLFMHCLLCVLDVRKDIRSSFEIDVEVYSLVRWNIWHFYLVLPILCDTSIKIWPLK